MIHQLSLLLGCLALLQLSTQASSLRSFSKPQVKEVTKAKAPRKYKPKIIKEEETPLTNAILIELPSYKSLTRKFSPSEIETRDQQALELLLRASASINPNIAKAQKISKRSFQELSQIRGITIQSNLEQRIPFSNFIFNSRSKEEALNQINSLLIQLEQDYDQFKAFYTERYQRDYKLQESSIQAKNRLINIIGQNTITEIEALIKGGRP